MSADPVSQPAAIRVDLGAIFVSLELSKSTWLVTSLSPGIEKMSRQISHEDVTIGADGILAIQDPALWSFKDWESLSAELMAAPI
jgi:hypothetical protein